MSARTGAPEGAPGTDEPVVVVVGPTATGKSELAVEIALSIGGEVVNADSMCLYRGMDIGTATPTRDQRRGVPHHLFDMWDVRHPASVAEYQARARAVIDDIRTRGRGAVLVGGSGLYVRAVLDDLRFPGTDPRVRSRLEGELAEYGAAEMHRRLADVDPEAAERILVGNGRRIVRALEVVELTGGSFAASLPEPVQLYPATQVGLDLPTDVLDERIELRVARMWGEGLLAEVARLEGEGLREGRTASRALGYREALCCLDGQWNAEQAIEATARATRRFARRQRSWFRRDKRIGWLQADGEDRLAAALAAIQPTIKW